MIGDKETRIRARAYELWQRDGRPEGRNTHHWMEAQHQIEMEDKEAEKNAEAVPADALLAQKASLKTGASHMLKPRSVKSAARRKSTSGH